MAKAKEIITAPHAQEIIPPTSKHFEYIPLTKDNGFEFLSKILQAQGRIDYSGTLATFNDCLLSQEHTIHNAVCLWYTKLPRRVVEVIRNNGLEIVIN